MTELLEKYPKAAKVVREYYLEQLLESLKEKALPEEFKEHVKQQGITDETVQGLVSGNPRLLFDVFDENELYITIMKDSAFTKPKFYYNVVLNDGKKYDNRKDAEEAAVREAFELLEQKL